MDNNKKTIIDFAKEKNIVEFKNSMSDIIDRQVAQKINNVRTEYISKITFK